MTTVINAHLFGGVEKLPPTAVYIGRPGPHGNAYSSKSGKFSREECVAFHRMDLYRDLIEDPLLFQKLKEELFDRDLACWCKQPKRLVACHGDNYVHIFKDTLKSRDYTKSVLHYLMDDLRQALSTLRAWIVAESPAENFLDLYLGVCEAKLEIGFLFTVVTNKKPNPEVICEYIARIVIELELALNDPDLKMKSYWLRHIEWTVNKLLLPEDITNPEPVSPNAPLPRRKKVRN